MLRDSRAQFIQNPIRFVVAVISCRSVVDLDQIDPAHRRAFALECLVGCGGGRLIAIEPGENSP